METISKRFNINEKYLFIISHSFKKYDPDFKQKEIVKREKRICKYHETLRDILKDGNIFQMCKHSSICQ